ncbi:MAG: MazG nucleotide pyrophosphohydrolase domain-containing protein [Candidatus Gracilibacteria bacterium]|nr:MazG nucleotide pyrophosphohydrolase domain-containing protein [Candidatus Gracilibacteria bacterium]
MKEILEKINTLSEKRIKFYIENKGDKGFYRGSKTYFEQISEELEEALDENRLNNSVHLEDELGDVLWCYLGLLNGLKSEGKITSVEKVFERSYNKFTGRIKEEDGTNNGIWNEVKKIRKLN